MRGAKGYDREELVDKAIELFRRQGYAGTSTAELVDELGVNRKSMYAEFGNKQGLFEASLQRYSVQNLTRVLAPIEDPDADAQSIRRALSGYAAASEGRFRGLGCLMANTAVERAALDPSSAMYVDAYLERLNSGFRRALLKARDRGQISEDADTDALAAFFAMTVVGVSALIRAKAPPEQVNSACKAAISMLDDAAT